MKSIVHATKSNTYNVFYIHVIEIMLKLVYCIELYTHM